MKVIQVFAKDSTRAEGAPPAEKLILNVELDGEELIIERQSDDPAGEFVEVPILVIVRANGKRQTVK